MPPPRAERATEGRSQGRLRSLAGQAVVYGLGGTVSKLIGIFLLPVYLHYAGKEAFGVVELVTAAIAVAAIALRLGIAASMSRFTLGDPDCDDWRPVVQTIFTFVMAGSTAAVIVGLPLSGAIAGAMHVSRPVAMLGLAGLWITMNYDVVARTYRIERNAAGFVAWSLVNIALTIILTVLFVVVLRLKAEGIMLGNFAGSYVIYAIILYRRRALLGVRHFDRVVLRRLLHFSFPLMPAGLALWTLNFADRFQVQRLAGPAALGSYTTANKIALGIMLVVSAFQTAWPPFIQSMRGERRTRDTFRVVMNYWAIVMSWGIVAITLLATPYVYLALPPNVHDAVPVIPLLMAGSVLYGGFLVVNTGVTFSLKTRMTPVVTTVCAATNIGLNFVLIPHWGLVGAGLSTVIGYLLLLLLGWMNAQRSYPVDYDWDRLGRAAALVCAYVAASIWLLPPSGTGPILLRLVLAASFPLALATAGVLGPPERKRLRGLLLARLPGMARG